ARPPTRGASHAGHARSLMLYLVRHAKAGSRREWTDDDRLRPLAPAGWTQSELLGNRLLSSATGSLVSSPYLRCMQTLQPLADLVGRPVVADDRLAEETGFAGAIELLATLPDGSVLCSHGDVIPDTIGALERRGCRIVGSPEWGKASVWTLTRTGIGPTSSITTAHATAPPASPRT
ncbi:MAG: phosphoglycerate mutase family protein, partial [Actinomycetota bacterium]